MGLKRLSIGRFLGVELGEVNLPPAWRKATRNMIMAAMSMQRAIQNVEENAIFKWPEGREEIGLIVGSRSGEIDVSTEFLATWHKSQMARPILFQNSLHSATTGFLAIQHRITGPTYTV